MLEIVASIFTVAMFMGWLLIMVAVVIVPLVIVPTVLIYSLKGTVVQTHHVLVQKSLDYIEKCGDYLDQGEIDTMFNEFSLTRQKI